MQASLTRVGLAAFVASLVAAGTFSVPAAAWLSPPVCLPASVAACVLPIARRRPGQRSDAVLWAGRHGTSAPARATSAQRRAVNVGRARIDGLAELLERRLEQQGGAGEVERAPGGAERVGEHGGEHVFVWCSGRRMDPGGGAKRDPYVALQSGAAPWNLQRSLQNVCSSRARGGGARDPERGLLRCPLRQWTAS